MFRHGSFETLIDSVQSLETFWSLWVESCMNGIQASHVDHCIVIWVRILKASSGLYNFLYLGSVIRFMVVLAVAVAIPVVSVERYLMFTPNELRN